MATDASGATFAPIFKGQTSADPDEIAELAAGGAEFHSEYIMSHGGAWRDPFTGDRIGGVQDFFGITGAIGPGLSPEMAGGQRDDGRPHPGSG